MANQQDSYTVSQGTGTGNRDFPFTFPSFTEGEVKVEIDNVVKTLTTHYTVVNHNTTSGGTVRFNTTGLPNGTAGTTPVRIFRQTDVDAPKAEFTAGASLKAGEINDNFKQLRHALQEAIGANATDRKVQEFNIEDGAVTTAKIKADNITSALIADDQINSEHYVADSIDSEHYAPNSVDTAAIGPLQVTTNELDNDAVTAVKIIDNAIQTEHYSDNSIAREHMQNNIVNGDKLDNNAVGREHIADGEVIRAKLAADAIDGTKLEDNAINTEHITAGAIDASKLSGATVVTASEQSTATSNDTSFLTVAAADARFFNISSGDTIKDGQTFPDNDTTIATTAAINDRIIDLVDDVGGFVPIANETSFPATNPDVNNGAGTIVSVSALSSSITTGSGVTAHTITNGAGAGNDVTITGLTASTTYPAGFGFLVETTSTLHTYTFHRLLPKATEVETVANIHGNVTTVAGISSDVTTVAGIHANVTTVAGISGNVTSVANNETNINAVKNNETNINAVKNNETNINTVATANTAVNTVATNISSVNNASANISSINNFGDTYQVASSNPSTDGGGNAVAEGDLYFNTSANRLKVYDGANWVDGVIASGGGAQTTGDTFTGDLKLNDNVNLIVGTGDDLKIHHDGTNSHINNTTGYLVVGTDSYAVKDQTLNEFYIKALKDGAVELYYNNNKKLETTSGGVTVTGNISLTGNVDGRDLAVDGAKLDNITANAIADLVEDTSPQLGGDLQSNGNDINFADNDKAIFGTGSDLQIYHDNVNSYIKEEGTGELRLGTDNAVRITKHDSKTMAVFTADGSSDLFYDNNKKFETTTLGIDVTGTTTDDGARHDGDVYFIGATSGRNVLWDMSENALEFADMSRATFGTSNDLEIYHDGSHSRVVNAVGNLLLDNSNGADVYINAGNDIFIRPQGSENGITVNGNGAVQLYHDNVKHFETDSGGVRVYDNDSTSYVNLHTTSGNAGYLYASGSTDLGLLDGNGSWMLRGIKDGAMELYHDATKRFETTNYGASLTGQLYTSDYIYINNGSSLFLQDNGKVLLGTGNDLQLYHDGNDSYIDDSGTGSLLLRTTNNSTVAIKNSSANMAIFSAGSFVKLYYNNLERFETTSEGATVEGPSSAVRLRFDTSTSHRGSLYFNNSNVGGFLDENGDWAVNFNRGGNSFLYSHWMPSSDSYDLGSSSYKWGEVHAVNFYGNGSNLTGVDPTIADGCIYENNQTISSTVSTSSSKNSFAAGDINITGTLTVADNTTFVIL